MNTFVKKNNTSGFTLVEIVVATLVFALAITGLFSTISSLNRPSVESFEESQAVYIGKSIAENLKSQIDADIWGESNPAVYNLVEGQTYNLIPVDRGGITYTGNYTVSSDPSGGRWVDLIITW